MSLRIRLLCACLSLLSYLHGQQDDSTMGLQELEEVVVTDSRFELRRENSGKTVIRIDSLELRQNQGRSVAEIINQKSGFEIAGSRTRQGEVLGVFARGGRGRQVLIIIDGVRVNDPASFSQEYDLRLLSTAQIASIEIIKGAASTLYGANAATAVINIVTRKPTAKKIGGEVQSSIGTNQSASDQNYNLAEFNNSANFSGTLNKFTYGLGFAHTYVNGLSSIITEENEEDPTSRYNADFQLGYRFTNDISIRVYANRSKLRTDYDESFGLMDAPYRFESEQKRIGFSGKWSFKNGELGLNTAYSDYNSENFSAFPGTFTGQNYVADLFTKYIFKEKFYTILGLNYIKDKADFTAVEQFSIADPYLNAVYTADFGLNINGGLRMNNHSEYGTHWVYNLNPSYVYSLSDGYIKALASYATSYITPSLTQLFGEFGANPDLEPETNRTLEAGLEYQAKGGLRSNLVYFNRREENFVFFDNTNFEYLNAEDTIDVQGVEFEIDWQVLEALGFSANYTFTERKGDNAIRIPKHKVNASMSYGFSENTMATATYAYTGQRTDTDFNSFNDVVLDPFSLFGLGISHEVLDNRLRLFFNIENIFNTDFTEVVGFTTRGRNMRFGLALTL
ncbi:MAG: TonB-dependent receptor [Flavobacteriaceae bacterium]